MKNPFLFLLTLFCALPWVVHAQSVTVFDRSSLQPLQAVTITPRSGTTVVTTDHKGRADLSAYGTDEPLQFHLLGYTDVTISRTEAASAKDRVYLTAAPITMDEFVLSASRFEEKRRDVPEQIALLKRRDISFLDQQSTGDLLQNSGALFVQKSQMGGSSPVIRGFEASRVLLVVDGVRMNNAIYRAGHLQDVMTVDQNSLERIEVISGPASVVYGSDALGGVVHMMTRSAVFNDTTGTAVGGGAFFRYSTANDEKTANANFSLSGRRVSSFTSITASDFGDLRQGSTRNPFYEDFGRKPFTVERVDGENVVVPNPDSNVQLGTAYKQIDMLEKLRVRSGERTVHQLNFQLSTSTDVPRYDRLSEYSVDPDGNIVPSTAEWYYGPQKRMLIAYTLELEKRGFFDQARITPSYQSTEASRHNRGFTSSRLNHRMEKVAVYGFNADLEKRMKKHELRYGLEFYHNDVDSKAEREHIETGELTYLSSRYPTGGSSMTSYAAYLSHTVEINEHWVISEGVRYTQVGLQAIFADTGDYQFLNGTVTQSNGAFNWRLGAMYLPGRDWRISILGSTGFRAPNVDDMGKVFDSGPGLVVVPNPDLKAESTINGEIGLSKTFVSRYTVDLNAFYTQLTNALVVGDFLVDGQDTIDYDGTPSRVTALTNKDEAYIYGASGQIAARLNDHFTLNSGLTYTYGRVRTDTTDVPLDHVPPVFGRTGLELRVKRLRTEVYTIYNGWKRLRDYSSSGEDNLQYATVNGMPAWCTVNVRASFAFTRNVSLQLGLENIADLNYRTFASGVSAPGRNFQISLRASF
ncbi:MAG: TonB-dependent receptor [Flavobacteriales bacterium]|nr:TonB-dependent receptor [Flavobacteriales bacterium]